MPINGSHFAKLGLYRLLPEPAPVELAVLALSLSVVVAGSLQDTCGASLVCTGAVTLTGFF